MILAGLMLGQLAGEALLNSFVNRLVEQTFSTAGNYAVNAVSNALPDFSSLGSMFGDVNKLADLTSGSLEDKKTALKNAILKQIEEMDVTVVTNSELKALRDIAQAADGNGDLNKALSEWKNLK
jgi:hypothetical protein